MRRCLWTKTRESTANAGKGPRPPVSPTPKSPQLEGKIDRFNGVTVNPSSLPETVTQFERALGASMRQWRRDKRKCVWLRVPKEKYAFMGALMKAGFSIHHAQSDYIMLTVWLLTDKPNLMPHYASTHLGAGALVVNRDRKVLVVTERYAWKKKTQFWKLPGGAMDVGEDIMSCAQRECLEETGVRAEPVSIIGFRHKLSFRFGRGDIYFIVMMACSNSGDIDIDPNELSAAKWIDLDEYLAFKHIEKYYCTSKYADKIRGVADSIVAQLRAQESPSSGSDSKICDPARAGGIAATRTAVGGGYQECLIYHT